MLAQYEVWLCSDSGERIAMLDRFLDLEFVKRVNGAGYFYLTIPAQGFDTSLLRVDNIVQIWRRGIRGGNRLECLGFLRRWKFVTSGGETEIVLLGPDQNDLLNRRIVAYAAGTTQAGITSYADNGMKDIFDENFLASASGSRNISSLGVSVAADTSDGPSFNTQFAWRPVMSVMQDINETSRSGGFDDEVFFEVKVASVDADSVPSFQFVTYTGQPGSDRTVTGTDPIIFSMEMGNLREPVLDYDYSLEENYIYACGQGEGSQRTVAEASDAARIGASQWNRREGFEDARHLNAAGDVVVAASLRLEVNRPRISFSGKLLDTEQTPYGSWNLGDKVTIFYLNKQLDVIIRSIYFRVSRDGLEDIQVIVEATNV